jgi:arabinose-5-phosphate isomerase
MGRVTKGDVILAISNSGETEELKSLLPHLKRMGCKIILITGNLSSALTKLGDIVIDAGVKKEACPLNLSPTASTTAALGLGDALAIALLEEHGFTEKDFALFHPGGDLGRRLHLKVSDIMRTKAQIPQVKLSASFQTIVQQINAKKVGCTLVIEKGQLKGIIVDGDIRRALLKNPDIRQWNARNLSTPQPKTISLDTSLAHALQLMEEKTIYQLIVVDSRKKPVGLVHLHDLLGRGQIQIG